MLEKQQIIISHFKQGKSRRQIAKEMQLNRRTVSRCIDEYEQERSSEEDGVLSVPKYDSTSRKKPKLTSEVISRIDYFLGQNDQKLAQGLGKQRMAGTDIYEALLLEGVQISYRTVINYIGNKKRSSQEVFVRQNYGPGQCCEFDWGEVKLKINGVDKRLMLAVFTMSCSNYRWAKLYYRQEMSCFLDSHVSFFEHTNGIPQQMVYDNMKVAVAKCTIRSSDKKPTEDLLKISTYYQFSFRFCNIAKGNEKGKVEKSVEYLRRKSFSNKDIFSSLDEANRHLLSKIKELNNKPLAGQKKAICSAFEAEKPFLGIPPITPYEIAIVSHHKIDKYQTISIDTNRYSVPESVSEPIVKVKIYPLHIKILDSNDKLVASHQRQHTKNQWFIDINHYWETFTKKPGALHRSEALIQAHRSLSILYETYFRHAPKAFAQIMLYCREQQIPIEGLLDQINDCKQHLLQDKVSSDHIIYLLGRKSNERQTEHKANSVFSQMVNDQCSQQLIQTQQLLQRK